jgi:ribosomal protein S18 acetylase RimI-like enzyme
MQPEFRLATNEDIDLLLAFMRQFYKIDSYPFDEQIARRALQDLVDDASKGRVWLIMWNDEAIGYVAITFGYSLEYHGRDAFIDELFIHADYRHQGLGTKVMQFVLDECPKLGVHALHLEVEHKNIAGQRLYRKFGFADKNRYMMTKRIMQ